MSMYRQMKAFFGSLLVLLVGLGAATDAEAANRTVCFTLRFKDTRTGCPESGASGVTRACNVDPVFITWSNPVGVLIDLWDFDSDGTPDEFIGTWRINGTGQRCLTFPWEGETYQNGEAHPDVYVKAWPIFRSTDGGVAIRGRDRFGDTFPPVSWRDEYVLNCESGANCNIGTLGYSTDANSEVNQGVVAMDSAQRVLEAFSGHIESGDIYIHLGREEDEAPCPNWSCARGNEIWIADGSLSNYDTLPHEMGHVLQFKELGITSMSGLDYSRGGEDGHTLVSEEWDLASTAEGWANYVASVAWWNPNVSTSNPKVYGYFIEEPAPHGGNCTLASRKELQVAKRFWDLDDTNQEEEAGVGDGDDLTSFATTSLLNFWSYFAPGTGDRQANENHANGVNVWDYAFNANYGLTPTQETSFIHHNCLTDQED